MTPKKENNTEEKKEETKKKKTTAKKASKGTAKTSKTASSKTAVKKTAVKKTTVKKKKAEELEEEKPFKPHQPSPSVRYARTFSNTEPAKTAPAPVKDTAPQPALSAKTSKSADNTAINAVQGKKETAPSEEKGAAQQKTVLKAELVKTEPVKEEKKIPVQNNETKKPAFVIKTKAEQAAASKLPSAAPAPASNASSPEKKAAISETRKQPETKTAAPLAKQQKIMQEKQQHHEERIFNQPAATAAQKQKSASPLPPLMRPKPKPEIPAIMRPSQPKQAKPEAVSADKHQTVKQQPKQNVNKAQANNNKQQQKTQNQPQKEQQKENASNKQALPKIKMSTEFVLRDLAEKLNVKPTDFIKKLMSMGVFATINQRLDKDTAILMAAEYGYDLELVPMFGEEELEEELKQEDEKDLKLRYPIITIMGHVDHGKTTLLDALRESNVVATEAGQITQHIGAYMVTTSRGKITILDTPGHEAFTAMRANGVKVTDIVVLVVSAVDGVMPQTLEAINHAKAANVPIIVAVNKIDLPTANPQQIKQQLSNYGLVSEEWGGQTPMIEISAKKRLNLDKLLEIISIQAEIMELKANPDKPGQAIVIEARLDPKKGVVATVIDVTGTLKPSDPFTVGTAYGKVRALISDRGDRLKELKPGEPAEVLGISGDVPQAGDILKVAKNDKEARHISEKRKLSRREESLSHQKQVSLMSLKSQVDSNELKNLNVVLKTDVFGSLQAIKDSLEKLSTPEVAISILHSGVGNITESDVLLAKASTAIIIGFHVSTDSKVEEAAKTAKVEIRSYSIIYDLIEDVKAAMSGMLAPEIVETVTGKAEIQQIFDLSSGKVCGSLAREGKITRGQFVHIIRGKDIIGNAKISGLKRFKEDVREVEKGLECGILLEGFKDFQIGDIIEAYNKEEKLRRLTNV